LVHVPYMRGTESVEPNSLGGYGAYKSRPKRFRRGHPRAAFEKAEREKEGWQRRHPVRKENPPYEGGPSLMKFKRLKWQGRCPLGKKGVLVEAALLIEKRQGAISKGKGIVIISHW